MNADDLVEVSYDWSDAGRRWVIRKDGREVGYIPGEDLGGSEHPRHYSNDELALMVVEAD